MLQTVSIQNFKSLKDVTVRLQKVNLLIGPNNSGKSNFLKALAFIKEHLEGRIQPGLVDLNRIYFGQDGSFPLVNPLQFTFKWDKKNTENAGEYLYKLEIFGFENSVRLDYSEAIANSTVPFKKDFKIDELQFAVENFIEYVALINMDSFIVKERLGLLKMDVSNLKNNEQFIFVHYEGGKDVIKWNWVDGSFLDLESLAGTTGHEGIDTLYSDLKTIKIYKPDPSKITKESLLLFDKNVNEDCSNLVAFLDNMRDEHPEVWKAIEKDLNKCIPQFEGINFGKVKINGNQESIGKRFGLRDTLGKTYWADELSEGTIYFLALLAIVHQPNPPKILLLEEPEKGIHPRRIAEVMNLIFRLADDKDIQIILTSHSTQVVDEFQDMPESVFVFDVIDGETKIKNLLTDIIEPDNEKAEQQNYPKLDFSKNSLGEHWAIGFLGGVPAK